MLQTPASLQAPDKMKVQRGIEESVASLILNGSCFGNTIYLNNTDIPIIKLLARKKYLQDFPNISPNYTNSRLGFLLYMILTRQSYYAQQNCYDH